MSKTDPQFTFVLHECRDPLLHGDESQTPDQKHGKCLTALGDDFDLKLEKSTEQNAGIFSKFFFIFVSQYLWRTRNAKSDDEFLEQPLDQLKSRISVVNLAENWEKIQQKGGTFFSAIFKTYGVRIACYGMLLFLEECIHLIQPIYMGKLINYFRSETTLTIQDAYFATGAVAITSIISPIIHHPYFYGLMQIGCETRVAASTLLYNKGLRLTASSIEKTSTGKLVNLLSTDAVKLDMAFIFIHYLWLSPILLFAYGYLIWLELGLSSIAGFAALFVLIVVQTYLSARMGMSRREIAKRADSRLSVMNEIITGIRTIKMHGWEHAFKSIVLNLRDFETAKILEATTCAGAVMGVFSSSSKIAVLCSLLVYCAFGNQITAERVFVAAALFNSCRLPFSLFFPFAIHLFTELKTTARRIQEFLDLDEFCFKGPVDEINEKNRNQLILASEYEFKTPSWNINKRATNDPKIFLKDLTTVWTEVDSSKKPAYAVRDVCLEADKNSVCIGIIGPVGSGKSSLLLSILGEAKIKSGILSVHGRVAYCAQEPWIFSGTIRENIVFYSQYDSERYSKIVELCALIPDFEMMEKGDESYVGDRGTTLSGGQRARIALARALYQDADIYLLDDPLSAVDVHVGKRLFEEVIEQFLKDKLVLLVTHQTEYFHQLNNVVLMKDNSVVGVGTMEQLKSNFVDLFNDLGDDEDMMTYSVVQSTPSSTDFQLMDRDISSCELTKNDTSGILIDKLSINSLEETTISPNAVSYEAIDNDFSPHEDRATGSVPIKIYIDYLKELSQPYWFSSAILFAIIITQILFNFSDFWLNRWVTAAEKNPATIINGSTIYNDPIDHFNFFGTKYGISFEGYKNWYTIVIIVVMVVGIARCILFRMLLYSASNRLHDEMISRVMVTDTSFFDNNPVGRILNRFSKDISVLDEQLPSAFFEFVMGFITFIGTVLVIIALNPLVVLATLPLACCFVAIRYIYLRHSRELKRIEATTRSPMNTHVSATVHGLPTIRAFGKEAPMAQRFYETQDMNMAATNLSLTTARWFALCIDSLVALFISATAIFCVYKSEDYSSGEVALMLVYAVQLTGFFSWIMRQSAELQNAMVSVERIYEYCNLTTEMEYHRRKDVLNRPMELDWPHDGSIIFENVSVQYGTEKALRNISFKIESGEKIGIVGRTGAGKSTILKTLFGLKTIQNGQIIIGGTNVNKLPLHVRRKRLGVIPQEPILFLGSIRLNLDPLKRNRDDALWNVLEQCDLKQLVSDMGGLDAQIKEGGTNLSVGQRQLFCLARALLIESKILIVDEATANVDEKTDAIIQRTIHSQLALYTIITIAHRLDTVMNCDRIMVLDQGRIVEFDTPYKLINNNSSRLWKMAVQSGLEKANTLKKAVEDCRSHCD